MADTQPQHRWYRLTPDRVMVAVLAGQVGLILADRYSLFGATRGELLNVLLAVALVGGALLLGLLWLIVGLLLGRRCQFGIRWLLLLTVAVAIPCSWYTLWVRLGERQKAASVAAQQIQSRICGKSKMHRQIRQYGKAIEFAPGVREKVVALSFAIEEDLGCGCCYGDVPTDVSGEDLRQLACLYHLQKLELPDARITDADLIHLSDLKNLRDLDLSGNAITDRGLVHLRGLKRLKRLNLANTEITDAGFVHLAALTNLEELDFGRTPATGMGVNYLAGCRRLKKICGVRWPVLSAAGLRAYRHLPGLEEFRALVARPDSDTASVEFDGHPKLKSISLNYGLHLEAIRLANLPALESAYLTEGPCIHLANWRGSESSAKQRSHTKCPRKVTEIRLENLPKLKNLQVGNSQRLVLRNVPNLTAVVLQGDVNKAHFRGVGRLPQLRSLSVTTEHPLHPDVLSELGRLPHLEHLLLRGEGLTDESMAALANFPTLKSLTVQKSGFSGSGLAHLQYLKCLERLSLVDSQDPGEPFACLHSAPSLEQIELRSAEIGALRLAGLPKLKRIVLTTSRIDVLELADLPMLEQLQTPDGTAIRRLSLRNLPLLRSVNLDDEKANGGLEHVELAGLPNLYQLYLSGDQEPPFLTDDCLVNVATFGKLQLLKVSNSQITDRTLERLMGHPKLRQLDAFGTATTLDAVERLRKSRPEGVRVYWGRPR